MLDHTPEPWKWDGSDSGDASFGLAVFPASVYADAPNGEQTADVVPICQMSFPAYREEPSGEEFDDGVREVGNQDANARRIVACVNACEGIPTESLERPAAATSLAQIVRNLLQMAADQGIAALLNSASLTDDRLAPLANRMNSEMFAYVESVSVRASASRP